MRKEVIGILSIFLMMSSLGVVFALTLTVANPVEGSIFNDRNVAYELTSDEISDFYIQRARLRSRSFSKLCDDVTSCNATVRAREGANNVSIRIVNAAGEVDTIERNFIVDTRKPVMTKTLPRHGSLVNENNQFTAVYSEDNLASVNLSYGNTTDMRMVSKTDCESGRRKECSFDVNLSDFDGQTIKYWFVIEDIAGNSENTTIPKLLTVDTTGPVVINKSFSVDRRRVTFVFDILEENFDKVILRDNSDRRPRWRRICSRLDLGTCVVRKSFRTGTHDIDVKALDKAGNEVDIYTNQIIII